MQVLEMNQVEQVATVEWRRGRAWCKFENEPGGKTSHDGRVKEGKSLVLQVVNEGV